MGKSGIKSPKYSIEVYEDHAIIRGWLTKEMMAFVIGLCKHEGFTHMGGTDDGIQGFKLFREE